MNPKSINAFLLLSSLAVGSAATRADAVVLRQPTATISQAGYSVDKAIDGTTADDRGWAILPVIGYQAAVFETDADAGSESGSVLTFTLTQSHSNLGHTLGRFRLSITTDNRDTFADGLLTGGDVTANWVVLHPTLVESKNGATLTVLGDDSVLAGGLDPLKDVYTVKASTPLGGITGIRLEAIPDPSLPHGGPGRYPPNGNFVLSEFAVDIVPRFAPKLAIKVSRVNVTMQVATGRKYQLETSPDLGAWTPTGPAFVADQEIVVQELAVTETTRFFRLTEVL